MPDLHGTLPDGTRVDGIADLKQVILENHEDDVLRSVTKNMLIYALGRPLDISDDEAIDQIIRHLKANQHQADSHQRGPFPQTGRHRYV